MSKNDLNNLEKKLSSCKLNIPDEQLVTKQLGVIKIAENFNFKETIEHVILNQAFTLENEEVDCKKLEVYSKDLKKLIDKIGSNVKQMEMQNMIGNNRNEWEKENFFMQTLNNDNKYRQTLNNDNKIKQTPQFNGSFKKKFED